MFTSSSAATRWVPALPRHQLVVAGGGGVQGRRLEAAGGDRQGAGRAGGSYLTGGDRGGEPGDISLALKGLTTFNFQSFMDYTTISQYLNCCNFQEKLWIREESILVTVTLRAVQHLHSMKFENQEDIVPSLSSDQPPGDLMQIQHVMSHVISSQMIM